MSEHTIDVEGIGTVTFKAAGKLEMKRIREAALRGGGRGYGSDEMTLAKLSTSEALRLREDALLISQLVIDPVLTDAEFRETFAGRRDLALEIAAAIREKSWPNP